MGDHGEEANFLPGLIASEMTQLSEGTLLLLVFGICIMYTLKLVVKEGVGEVTCRDWKEAHGRGLGISVKWLLSLCASTVKELELW